MSLRILVINGTNHVKFFRTKVSRTVSGLGGGASRSFSCSSTPEPEGFRTFFCVQSSFPALVRVVVYHLYKAAPESRKHTKIKQWVTKEGRRRMKRSRRSRQCKITKITTMPKEAKVRCDSTYQYNQPSPTMWRAWWLCSCSPGTSYYTGIPSLAARLPVLPPAPLWNCRRCPRPSCPSCPFP